MKTQPDPARAIFADVGENNTKQNKKNIWFWLMCCTSATKADSFQVEKNTKNLQPPSWSQWLSN